MKFDYRIEAIFYDGSSKSFYFFSRKEAQEFKEDIYKWMFTLNIKEMSNPIKLN